MGSSYSYSDKSNDIPEQVPPILTKYTPKEASNRFESMELKNLQKTFKSMLKASQTHEGVDENAFAKHFLDNASNAEEESSFNIPSILANHLYSVFDPNKQGYFTMDEFIVVMAVAIKAGVEDRLDLAFHVLSGYHESIGRKSLSKVLKEIVSLSDQLLKNPEGTSSNPHFIEDTVENAFEKFSHSKSKSTMSYSQYRDFVNEHNEIGDFLQVLLMKSFDSEWTPAYLPVIPKPPSPPKMDSTSELLSEENLLDLQTQLPAHEVGNDLHLLYSSSMHGYSLLSIIGKCKSHAGSVLFVLKASSGERIGAYLSQSFKESSGSYYGDESSFLFRIKGSKMDFFTEHSNLNIVKTTSNSITIGGPEPALTIDSELDKCTTLACPTFHSPVLLKTNNFRCVRVEIWSFQKKREEDSFSKASSAETTTTTTTTTSTSTTTTSARQKSNLQAESRKSFESASSGRKSNENNNNTAFQSKAIARGPANAHIPVYRSRTSMEELKKFEEAKELEQTVNKLRMEVAELRRSMSIENVNASLSQKKNKISKKKK